ncbi:MAG: alpha/beta fold hydrolase, partial [Actinobacteria bacterium]|nr:alpha/beta fold hydrolase [Actinomycetota bacterium]
MAKGKMRAPIEPKIRVETSKIHGNDVSFRRGGTGETLLFIHGIAGSCDTFDTVLPEIAKECEVIAPDLLGHGRSAKPRGDYSLGAYASGLRDLLEVLEVDKVSIVGHSMGGGVAMQFAYQFPERCSRLVLVSSGGLGPEVTPLLRAATLPGAEAFLSVATHARTKKVVSSLVSPFGKLGIYAKDSLI